MSPFTSTIRERLWECAEETTQFKQAEREWEKLYFHSIKHKVTLFFRVQHFIMKY